MLRRKHILSVLCMILFIGLATPQSTATATGPFIKVGTDYLNIRKGPGLSYPIVAKANKGDQYPLLSESGDWIEIQLKNGAHGWVATWLVTKVKKEQTSNFTETPGKIQSATISTDALRIRKGPGTSFPVIGTVYKGELYTVKKIDGKWINLQTPYGNGWVSGEYIQINNNKSAHSSNELSGSISVNSLNVRRSPSLNSSIIGKLSSGDTVKILSQTKDWSEISFSGSVAWVSSQYIQLNKNSSKGSDPNDHSKDYTSTGKSVKVTVTSLIVRDTPSLNGQAIGSVQKNQNFQMIEEANNWVKIEYKRGEYGWVASWYLDKSDTAQSTSIEQDVRDSSVRIIHNGSNIRKRPEVQSEVIQRANQGEVFEIVSILNDWYEIRLKDGQIGYIAGWIVSVNGSAPMVEKPGAASHLKNKRIVIDPGHGGRDNGTTGARGTIEKTLTLKTAQSLYEKLNSAGANVFLTRNNDTYIPLSSRVYTSHYHNADAFISIHYDSILDRSVRGMTTYYYHSYQKSLAASVHSSITSQINLKDRDYRFGDYYVLRENKQKAILLELGYLSNPTEELLVSSNQFQDSVSTGIYQGIARYFKNN